MKKAPLFLWLLWLMTSPGYGQSKLITREGHIWFFSSAPLENIEAHNRRVSSALDMTTGSIVFSMRMDAFEFKKKLMQEHFNENYVESEKFPSATFKGKIDNWQSIDLTKEATYPVKVSGELTIHGVTKPIKADGTLQVKGNQLLALSKFIIAPEDYNIEIPSIVRYNIAEQVDVHVDIAYTPLDAN